MKYMGRLIRIIDGVSPNLATMVADFVEEQKRKLRPGATQRPKSPSLLARPGPCVAA